MWTISSALLTFSFLIFDVADIVTTPNASDDVTATTTTAAAIVTFWQWSNQWWSRHAAVKRGANMTVRIVDSRTCSCCFPLLSPLFQVNDFETFSIITWRTSQRTRVKLKGCESKLPHKMRKRLF
jgi:hypothetical protein